MNKLAIFDLDGTLCDLRALHFRSLNTALQIHNREPISETDHLIRFDGRPTSEKLRLLNITGDEADQIAFTKQELTLSLLPDHVRPDPELAKLLHAVYAKGYLLAVVSNARQETVRKCLELLSVEYLFAWVVTPDLEGQSPKPSPEMHLKLMCKANACPASTVIFEDAPAGLRAAYASGARVGQVNGKIDKEFVLDVLGQQTPPYRYQWPDLNVLIPAAGKGQRFKEAGYKEPKPFIDVEGYSMLQSALINLGVEGENTFVVRDEDLIRSRMKNRLPGAVIELAETTQGTACSCLRAKGIIWTDDPLLIANCDQILEWDHLAFYYFCQNTQLDGVIVTFDCPEPDPRWSYCELNADGTVKRVAEKEPISSVGNVGVYWWAKGSDFVKYAERMIEKDIRVNNEFYVAPVYNLAIEDGKKIGVFRVDRFWSLGTPAALQEYLERVK